MQYSFQAKQIRALHDLTGVRSKLLVTAGVIVVVLIIAWAVAAPMMSGIVRARMITALEENFASTLEVKNLEVSMFPRVTITGEAVAFHLKDRPGAPPLFTIHKLTVHANFFSLLARHVSQVVLEGLAIEVQTGQPKPPSNGGEKKNPPRFIIDEIVADGTSLKTLPKDSWKDPLVFDIKYLRLTGGGPQDAMTFKAELINAKPPGEIKSDGKFGPWDREDPAGTLVSGKYTFRDADLGVFKGIAGKLSSDGDYKGSLGNIDVEGTTDVPDFRLTDANNPVHLTTKYKATVDGTSGNTYLHEVDGQFGHTSLVAKGEVAGTKGIPGKTVTLDAVVQKGRLEDMLHLAVKGPQPAISGAIRFNAKIVIPPGQVDVVEKININGAFNVDAATFSQMNVQEKVNELSHRAEGKPKEPADEGTVASDFKGKFQVDKGVITLTGLSFAVPGVEIQLNGTYGMIDTQMNFKGTAKLDAKVSQMTTGWKSMLLKAVDPIFKKKNVGAQIPIHIGGTPEKPSFGLAF